MNIEELSCVDCHVKACRFSDIERMPAFCMTKRCSEEDIEQSRLVYDDVENNAVMLKTAELQAESYGRLTRVEETIEFAKKMGFKKIGIATCTALIQESGILAKILRKNGFEVISAGCKVGIVPKDAIGIPEEHITQGPNICNPVMQAKVLNEAKTDFNIVMGLCVGHDSLFYKYVEGLTTTMVVKDRVTGHNPVAPLYTAHSFYKDLI